MRACHAHRDLICPVSLKRIDSPHLWEEEAPQQKIPNHFSNQSALLHNLPYPTLLAAFLLIYTYNFYNFYLLATNQSSTKVLLVIGHLEAENRPRWDNLIIHTWKVPSTLLSLLLVKSHTEHAFFPATASLPTLRSPRLVLPNLLRNCPSMQGKRPMRSYTPQPNPDSLPCGFKSS